MVADTQFGCLALTICQGGCVCQREEGGSDGCWGGGVGGGGVSKPDIGFNSLSLPPMVADMPMSCMRSACLEYNSLVIDNSRGRPRWGSHTMCSSSTTTHTNSPTQNIQLDLFA